MRVLAICMEDPEFILGGMGRHVRELYRAMSDLGDIEVDLLTMGPGEGPRGYLGFRKHLSDKLVCYKPPRPGMSTILISDIQMLRTLMKMLADGDEWDVIHVHEWNAYQVARAARDATGLPLVGTMHLCITKLSEMDCCPTDKREPYQAPPEDDVYLMQMEGHLVADSDELILCSDAYCKIIRQTFMIERPINKIYNGIRLDDWHPAAGDSARARADHDLPDRPIALFVGRIADMKGIRPLLDVVENADTGYCVVLAGEVNANNDELKEAWDVTKRIRKLIAEYPERLQWVGFQSDQNLKDLYAMAAVGLMPSVHEPFGIVALEHMAMGVPLISTEVDGLGEIVCDEHDDEYAMIVRPNESGDIAEALETLKSSAIRSKLVHLGLKRAKDFDWHKIARETVEVYASAIRRSSCRKP